MWLVRLKRSKVELQALQRGRGRQTVTLGYLVTLRCPFALPNWGVTVWVIKTVKCCFL